MCSKIIQIVPKSLRLNINPFHLLNLTNPNPFTPITH